MSCFCLKIKSLGFVHQTILVEIDRRYHFDLSFYDECDWINDVTGYIRNKFATN